MTGCTIEALLPSMLHQALTACDGIHKITRESAYSRVRWY
jgi:hypothetical protein